MPCKANGNAGSNLAKLLHKFHGCKIVAVSDSRWGICNKNGLDPMAVQEHKAGSGSVNGFPNSEVISNEQVLELDVDIFAPAALEKVIVENNVEKIRAKIVAELANGPSTPEADAILYKRGVHVIPDILCNAGGVTVSCFEMVQNSYMYYWDENHVHELLEKKMAAAYQSVFAASQNHNVDMRTAAYVVAVARVADAMATRGWV